MVFEEFNEFASSENEDEFINEYVVYYSKYLLTSYFDCVKIKIAELARRGHVRSLAKYLKKVKPENWDEDLKQMALAIKNKKDAKTAPEWEVVAAFDWHKPLERCMYDVKDIKTLREVVAQAGKDFYYASEAYHAGILAEREYLQKRMECMQLTEAYARTDYLQTLKKVQEAYYSAFVKDGNLLDAVGFLEATVAPDDFYVDEQSLKEYGHGTYFSHLDIARSLIRNFDAYKKNDDVPYDAFFAYGFALTLYGKNDAFKNRGIKALSIVSEFSLDDEPQKSDDVALKK